MAYGYIHDKVLGRARWTVDCGKILDEDDTQVGTERDGIAYRMSGEVWGALHVLNSEALPAPEVTQPRKAGGVMLPSHMRISGVIFTQW